MRIAIVVIVLVAAFAALGVLFLTQVRVPAPAAPQARIVAIEDAPPPIRAAAGLDGSPALPAGRLRGLVLDATGIPLPDATVTARALAEDGWPGPEEGAPAVSTNALGMFAFPEIPAGRYALEARDDRGWGMLPAVAVYAEGTRDVEIRLFPEAEIAGRVVDENGNGIAGATVTTDLSGFLRYLGGRTGRPRDPEARSFTAVADDAGEFRLERLPIGRYDLAVQAPGQAARTIPGVVAPVSDVALMLYVGFELKVGVSCRGHETPPWIRIATEPPDAVLVLETIDDLPGVWGVLSGLPEGRIRVVASAPGYASAAEEVEIVAGQTPPSLSLRLEEGDEVTGRVVVAGSSRVVAGARLEFRSALGATATAETNDKGAFEARIGAGGHTVVIRAEGYREFDAPLFADWPRHRKLTFALTAEHALTGLVTWADGVPVPGATVTARDLDRESGGEAITDPAGRFRIADMRSESRYQIVAREPGGARAVVDDFRFPHGAATVERDLVLESRGRGDARGRVIDEREDPVARALILIPGATAQADADGRFTLSNVPAGRRGGWILAAGHPPVPLVVDFPKKGVADLGEILLPWNDPMIWGTVRTPDGAPFGGARVRLLAGTGEVLASGLSASDGTFGVAWPLPRTDGARLRISAPGRVAGELTGDFDALSRTEDVTLARPGRIVGRIAPLPTNALVLRLFPEGSGVRADYPVELDRAGRLAVRNVFPGRYQYEMVVEGPQVSTQSLTGEIEVPEGGEADLGKLRVSRSTKPEIRDR